MLSKLEVTKIVGASNQHSWCQVHAFTPEDEKKREAVNKIPDINI